MKPPSGYSHSPSQVCRLRLALYGHKQDLRDWFAKFSSIIGNLGSASTFSDSGLFIHKTDSVIILLLLYVDDTIITKNYVIGISDLKCSLS